MFLFIFRPPGVHKTVVLFLLAGSMNLTDWVWYTVLREGEHCLTWKKMDELCADPHWLCDNILLFYIDFVGVHFSTCPLVVELLVSKKLLDSVTLHVLIAS